MRAVKKNLPTPSGKSRNQKALVGRVQWRQFSQPSREKARTGKVKDRWPFPCDRVGEIQEMTSLRSSENSECPHFLPPN